MEQGESGTEKLSRLFVSAEAERMLIEIVEAVNDGFRGGKVSKVSVVEWMIRNAFEDRRTEKIDAIRKKFFDQVSYLESVVTELKRARRSGSLSTPCVDDLLAPILRPAPTEPSKNRRRPDKKGVPL
jgi:hypothetical protein